MNVADPICTYQNLAEHVSASDVHFIRSVFTNGLHKMIFHLEKLNTHFINIPPTLPPIDMNGEDAATVVDSGSQPTTQTSIADPFESLLFQCFGKTRQISLKHKAQAVTVHDLAFIEQLKKNPCYRDNAIVSSPDILLKQGEFILMGIQVIINMSSYLILDRIRRANFKLHQLLLRT